MCMGTFHRLGTKAKKERGNPILFYREEKENALETAGIISTHAYTAVFSQKSVDWFHTEQNSKRSNNCFSCSEWWTHCIYSYAICINACVWIYGYVWIPPRYVTMRNYSCRCAFFFSRRSLTLFPCFLLLSLTCTEEIHSADPNLKAWHEE